MKLISSEQSENVWTDTGHLVLCVQTTCEVIKLIETLVTGWNISLLSQRQHKLNNTQK